jgi:hypothetical protein
MEILSYNLVSQHWLWQMVANPLQDGNQPLS